MFQRTLKLIESWKGDGAQTERRGQAKGDASDLEKWEMEAPGGSRGKSMRAHGNGGGQHPVAAHLIPLRPTCHVKCYFQRSIMITSPPFMSLNFRRFSCFCTVA